jgi:hypothetical protein
MAIVERSLEIATPLNVPTFTGEIGHDSASIAAE